MPALLFVASLSLASAAAQTPAAQPAPKPAPAQPATPPAPAAPRPRAAAAAARLSVTIYVNDSTGTPARDVKVTLSGPADREGDTGDGTPVRFQRLRAGTYRARFSSPKYVLFEKEIVVRGGTNEDEAVLSPAPEPAPPAPSPAPAATPPPAAARTLPPPSAPAVTDMVGFIEKNYITNRQPQKETDVACSGDGRAVLLQVRDPLENRSHDDYDEFLYAISGEGTLRVDNRDLSLTASNGTLALVPRGSTHQITRKGRNPLILLSVRAGAPCP